MAPSTSPPENPQHSRRGRRATDPVPPGQPVDLSVVIPVYNEEGILAETVGEIATGLTGSGIAAWEIILCENGSTDGSTAVAETLARAIPRIRIISLPRPDYGAAMRRGFLESRGDSIVNFDADYYDLDFLARALDEDADIAIAAKQLLGSHDARILSRRLISRAFGRLVRSILGVTVTETHGMKVFRRSAVMKVVPLVVASKDLFDTELIARAEREGLKIVELPIRTEERRHSRTGIWRRVPRTLWGLFAIRRRLNRRR